MSDKTRAPISISHVEAGGNIYVALDGSAISIDPQAPDLGLPSLAQPKLAEFEPEDAIDESGVDVFRLLRWDYRLVDTLYGRDDELQSILKWADRGSNAASARLVSGSGGVGKTRLAAEAARSLRDKGWTAGFIPADARSRPFRIAAGTGLFLILDYPEERPEETQWLFRLVADLVDAPCPIRVLLLSRREFGAWEQDAAVMEGRFGRQSIAALGGLALEQTVAVIGEAAKRFADLIDRECPDLSAASAWVGRSPDNGQPLYATAAALHAVLEPEAAFELGGGEIIGALAKRERRRVDAISLATGLGKTGLAQLLALGVLADGLTPGELRALAAAGAVEATPETVVDRVAQTPWWRASALVRLEPDKPAAAFLEAVLFPPNFPSGREELPEWLFVSLRGRVNTLADRLGRVQHDLFIVSIRESVGHALDSNLVAMLEHDPTEIAAFSPLAFVDASVWVAPVAASVARVLSDAVEDPGTRAALLGNCSNYLSTLGDREEALAVAKEVAELYRELARAQPEAFTVDLAMSLNNLANRLSDLGHREEALAVAKEAVTIRRELVRARPDTGTPDLAMSLNNFANRLSELGHREEALATAQEAVGLYRELADARSEVLAGLLNNLANKLSAFGKRYKALAVAGEAVGLYRNLARARPDTFTPDLATSLNSLAKMLSESDQHEEALIAAKEAVTIRRELARARPDAFTPDLAMSLSNFATMLAALGRREEALAAAKEAVTIRRELARARPDVFEPNLATSLNNIANILSELGQREEALAAAKEAVTIRRELARARPDAFTPYLAMSLNNVAKVLSELGRREEALVAAMEAVGLYRDLASTQPDLFEPNLATMLYTVAHVFFELGRSEEGRAAADEAAAIRVRHG